MVDKLPLPVSLNWWTPDSFHQWYRDCIKPPRMTMTTLHWSRPRPRTLQRRGLVNHHDPTKHFRPFFWGVQTVVFFGGGAWCLNGVMSDLKFHHFWQNNWFWWSESGAPLFFGSPKQKKLWKWVGNPCNWKKCCRRELPLTMQKCHSPDVFSKTGSVQTPEILVYVKTMGTRNTGFLLQKECEHNQCDNCNSKSKNCVKKDG